MPFPRPSQDPYLVTKLKELFLQHPDTTIIWAHVGLGRVFRPVENQLAMVDRFLNNPDAKHVCFDISWDETAKYLVETPKTVKATVDLINRYPERFLFGTDTVAPKSQNKYLEHYDIYAPLLEELTPRAKRLLLKGNYERIFDQARKRVRRWEKANVLKSAKGQRITPADDVK